MSRLHQFAANVRFNVYGQLLQAALPLFITPFILGRLGQEAYGIFVVVDAVISHLNLLGFGTGPAVVKYLAEFHASKDRSRVRGLVGSSMLFYGVSGALGAAVLIAAIPFLKGRLLHLPPTFLPTANFIFACGACAFLFQAWSRPFQAVPQALHRFDMFNAAETGLRLAQQLGICALLAAGFWLRAVTAWTALVAAAGLLVYAWVARRLLPGEPMRPSYDAERMAELFGFGRWLFIAQMAWSVLNQADKIVLGHYVSMGDLVFYLVPFALAQKLFLIVGPLLPMVLPLSSELAGRSDMDSVRRLFIGGTRLSVVLLAPFVILGFVFGPAFLELWLGGGYSLYGGWILRWLILANFFNCMTGFGSFISQGFGRYRWPTLLFSGLTALAVLSWPLLLPRFGLVSASWIYLGVQLLNAVGLFRWYLGDLLRIPAGALLRAFSKPFAASLPLIAASALLRNSLKGWISLGAFGLFALLAWSAACWVWVLDADERRRVGALWR